MPVAMQCPTMAPSATKYGFCAAASACHARSGHAGGGVTGMMGVKYKVGVDSQSRHQK
jgi:hypothetical protein